MHLQPQADSINPRFEEYLRLHRCWAWFVGLGVVLIMMGALAVGAAFLATEATIPGFWSRVPGCFG